MSLMIIPVEKIVMREGGTDATIPYSPAVALRIADSARAVGLLQPIGVRPIPGTDTYELIFGRHRLAAYRDHLKRQEIAAFVFDAFDDVDAELATLAENLWRNPLKRSEFLIAVRRWFQLYEAKYPGRVRKASSGSKAKPETADPGATLALGNPDMPAEPEPPTFPKLLAEVTGQSVRSAERVTRIARSFAPEQLATLEARKLKKGDMEALAAVDDQPARDQAVALVAEGLDAQAAIHAATGIEKPERRSALTLAVHDDDEREFISAVERWKGETGRKFPTLSEILGIVKALGYSKPARPRRQAQ